MQVNVVQTLKDAFRAAVRKVALRNFTHLADYVIERCRTYVETETTKASKHGVLHDLQIVRLE